MSLPVNRLAAAIVLASVFSFAVTSDADAATKAKPKAAAKKAPAKSKASNVKAPQGPDACTDFYSFANEKWLKDNPLGGGVSAYSSLSLLRQNADAQQAALLNSFMTAPSNNTQKILGDFWASGLDEASIEADGAQPIAPLLSRINAIRTTKDIAPSVAALHVFGLPVLFNFAADVDLQDLNRSIGYFTQGGIGLPDAAIYTNRSPEITKLMQQYREYVGKMLLLSGTAKADVPKEMGWVMAIENDLAAISKSNASLDILQSQYAAIKTKGLNRHYGNLQLEEFLRIQGVRDDIVSIADDTYFSNLNALLGKHKPEQWRAYLRWRVADSMAPYLSKAWSDAAFDFRGRILQGRANPGTRAQRALAAVNDAAGPMLGREYSARYLAPHVKTNAEAVAGNVRSALIAAIDRNAMMSPSAKKEALAKARKIGIEVGYPARDLDYTIQPMGRGSFGSNILIASTWQHAQEMKRIGKGNASRRWDVLPQNPVISYQPEHNRLIVTAAALQAPIYSSSAAPAAWYGSLGAMIGHELSRGFDLDGRMINANGKISNWWTTEDIAQYDAMARKVSAQYQGRPYPSNPASKVNGSQVLNVALADQNGVELARDAYVAASPSQAALGMPEFFRAWAGLWAQQVSPALARMDALESSFAPGIWRTNIPLSNLPEFSATFACPSTAPMVATPAMQVRVWP